MAQATKQLAGEMRTCPSDAKAGPIDRHMQEAPQHVRYAHSSPPSRLQAPCQD